MSAFPLSFFFFFNEKCGECVRVYFFKLNLFRVIFHWADSALLGNKWANVLATTQLARPVLIRISVLIILTQCYKCTFSTQKFGDPYNLLLLSHHRKSVKVEAAYLPAECMFGICANK